MGGLAASSTRSLAAAAFNRYTKFVTYQGAKTKSELDTMLIGVGLLGCVPAWPRLSMPDEKGTDEGRQLSRITFFYADNDQVPGGLPKIEDGLDPTLLHQVGVLLEK